MARKRDDPVADLRAAIEQLAADDVTELIAEARAEARARVRSRLTEAFTQSLLDHLEEQLSPGLRSEHAPQPTSASPPIAAPAEREVPRRRERAAARKSAASHGPAHSHERAASPTRADGLRDGELAWYVYGVVRAEAEDGLRVSGVEPAHRVAIVREGPLGAVASRVPLEEFGESRLREHLGDMAWVEATARAHEAVLDEVQGRMTVIPMRMCSVYRTEDGVRELLLRESEPLQQALEHLQGKAEWGVKVFADSARVPSGTDDHDEKTDPAGGTPGAAYMQRKREERDAHERIAELLEEASAQIHERLAEVAFDGLVLTPQRPEATGRDGEMILNGVYLVLDQTAERFHTEVRELQSQFGPLGIELESTGPWPAYNFVPGTIGSAW